MMLTLSHSLFPCRCTDDVYYPAHHEEVTSINMHSRSLSCCSTPQFATFCSFHLIFHSLSSWSLLFRANLPLCDSGEIKRTQASSNSSHLPWVSEQVNFRLECALRGDLSHSVYVMRRRCVRLKRHKAETSDLGQTTAAFPLPHLPALLEDQSNK